MTIRDRFEHEMLYQCNYARDIKGEYIDVYTAAYWRVWQKAWQAVEAQQQARIDELERDAARYRWIRDNVTEKLTDGSANADLMFGEHKTQYVLPKLISWADFCGGISLDDAIDYKIDAILAAGGEVK